jgi:hypothetical protein
VSSSKSRSSQPQHKPRPQYEPPLEPEAEDFTRRRLPPQPLKDLVGDRDDALDLPRLRDIERPRPIMPAQPPERQLSRSKLERQRRQQVAVRQQDKPMRAPDLIAEAEAVRRSRLRAQESEADLFHAERLTARPYVRSLPVSAPPLAMSSGVLLFIVFSLSVLVLGVFGREEGAITSAWNDVKAAITGEAPPPQIMGALRPAGDYTLKAAPSISPQQIDRILAAYNSPAAGSGAVWYNLGVQYGIDPAFAVAFFIHESGAGTARNWAGLKPDGSTTHNVGNIICAGYATCFNRFRDYPSWEAGIKDWYRLIDVEYVQGRGHRTVADVIPVYAPAFENDVDGYVSVVHRLVDQWRQGRIP